MGVSRPIFAAAACILFIIVSGPISWTQMPQWSRIGPWGGGITALGYADSVIFAGTDGSGVYRSTDYGTTWEYIQSSVVDDHAGAFVAHGTTIIKYGGYDDACRSSDRGKTWQMLNTSISHAVMDFLGDTLISITRSGEAHGSVDYGGSWKLRSRLPDGTREINCIKIRGNEMLVGTNWGLFYSNDGARSWEELQVHPSDSCIKAVYITAGTILAAGMHDANGSDIRIYYSTNRGGSWLQSQGMTAGQVHEFVETRGKIMAATGYEGGVFSSTDGGVSWQRGDNWTDGGAVQALVAIGDTILAGEGLQRSRGISRSFDAGATWQYSNTGLSGIGVGGLIFHGNTLLMTGRSDFYDYEDDGVYRSTDRGESWARADLGPQRAHMYGIISCGDVLICGRRNLTADIDGDIYRSTDGGETWTRATTESVLVRGFTSAGSTIAALVQLGAINMRPYISTDCGATWNVVPSPSSFTQPVPNHILLAGSTLLAFAGSRIFRSDDLGLNWTIGDDLREVVTAVLTIGDTIVLSPRNGSITRSTDYGKTWIDDARAHPGSGSVVALAFWQGDLYVATMGGIYRSTDAGDSWSTFSTNPGGRYITTLAVHNSMLYVGTSNNGVFVTTAPSSVAMRNNEDTWFTLAPNPTSGATVLRCLLPTPGYVNVEIFNGIGERVMSYREMLPSGEQTIRFDVSGQAPGYYLVRIVTPERIAVKKMLVGTP